MLLNTVDREYHFWIRISMAIIISFGLAAHGKSKKSLSTSGAAAAVFVGFCSFAASYRFGTILILFYYTGSKLTKVKEDLKAKLEEDYAVGGQRNWIQVFANSILATIACISFYVFYGEDNDISFGGDNVAWMRSQILIFYISHYACAAADTWASELGILSKTKPRLVTTFFLREVPPGTNGGMSVLGTIASAAGGAFIGTIFWAMSYITVPGSHPFPGSQLPAIVVGTVAGLVGSLFDSILGATVQASYYSKERNCIVKTKPKPNQVDIVKISGYDIVSNEAVNFWSILMTCILMYWLSPVIFCAMDSQQCAHNT